MIGNQQDSFDLYLRNQLQTIMRGKNLPTLGNLFPEDGEGNHSSVLSGQQTTIKRHIVPVF